MDSIIVYVTRTNDGLCIGNVDGHFLHNPPTVEDIRNMEAAISEKHCAGQPVSIVNVMRATPSHKDETTKKGEEN